MIRKALPCMMVMLLAGCGSEVVSDAPNDNAGDDGGSAQQPAGMAALEALDDCGFPDRARNHDLVRNPGRGWRGGRAHHRERGNAGAWDGLAG